MRLLLTLLLVSLPAVAGKYPLQKTHLVWDSPYLQVRDFVMVDIDNDDDLDIIATNAGTGGPGLGNLYLFENRGKAKRWARKSLSDMLRYPDTVVVGDLDGDKDLDIVVSAGGPFDQPLVRGGLHWFENLGGSAFKPHAVADKAAGPRDIALVDLDEDGDLDVVGSARKTLYWENLGGGKFEEGLEVLAKPLTHLEVVKVGDATHLVGASDDYASYVYEEGSLEKKTSLSQGSVSMSQRVDFDGDGDLDVVFSYKKSIAVAVNDGSALKARVLYEDERHYLVGVAVDLDGDKAAELLLRQQNQGLAWARGDLKTAKPLERLGDMPRLMRTADLDGDGDPDLVGDTKGGYKLSWWENKAKRKK